MKYLLDTHALIWAAVEPERLSSRVRLILEKPKNEVYFSSISLLEISIKYKLGKLKFQGAIDPPGLLNEIRTIGFSCLNFECLPAATLYQRDLPPGDPFDRILCHLALEYDMILLSKDPFFKKVKHTGVRYVW